jgi:hypothetical protein
VVPSNPYSPLLSLKEIDKKIILNQTSRSSGSEDEALEIIKKKNYSPIKSFTWQLIPANG